MSSCFLLVPALVQGLVSLLVSLLVFLKKECVPSWFHASCWFRLWFRGLSPFLPPFLSPFLSFLSFLKKGVCSIMISCFLLVPALVPGLVSLLVPLLVSSFFAQKRSLFHHYFLLLAGSGSGSGACLPSSLFFLFQERGSVPSWCPGSSWFRLRFRCLSPFLLSSFLSQEMEFVPSWSWFLLVPARVPVLVSLVLSSCFSRKGVLFHHDVLALRGSGSGAGACLPSSLFFTGNGVCSIMICWLLLVPARVRVVVSLLISSLFFSGNGVVFHHDFLVPSGSGSGSGACLPSFFCQEEGFVPF